MRILYPGSPSPDNLINPLTPEQPKQIKPPPTDTSVIGALLGEGAAEDFTALLPHKEQEISPKADLPGGEFVLSEKEAEQADAREQETPEQQARAWFLSLGKDEDWIEERFTFEGGITCIADNLNLANCNIAELPSFFGEIKEIKNLNLTGNLLTTLHNMPKEIGGDLYLSNNPGLTSCAGLEGIRVGKFLHLEKNINLISCKGLEMAKVEKNIFLSNNPSLTSLEGLPPRENIGGSLVFHRNQQHLIQQAKKKGYNVYIAM